MEAPNGECVENYNPYHLADQVHCPDGSYAPKNFTGGYEYRYFPDYEETVFTCLDGSDRDNNGLCPEDYEDTDLGCPCECKTDPKSGRIKCKRVCPGMPENGKTCGGGPPKADISQTIGQFLSR